MQQNSQKRERDNEYSRSLALSDIPEYSLSDMGAKLPEPIHRLPKGGILLFGDAKRKKHNGFFGSCCVNDTFVHSSRVVSNDSLRFPSEAPTSSSCHDGTTTTCTHVVVDRNAQVTHAESMQSMLPAVAPNNHNHASRSLHDLPNTLDACAIVIEKVHLNAHASHFGESNSVQLSCDSGWLSLASMLTDVELFSSSEGSPSDSP